MLKRVRSKPTFALVFLTEYQESLFGNVKGLNAHVLKTCAEKNFLVQGTFFEKHYSNNCVGEQFDLCRERIKELKSLFPKEKIVIITYDFQMLYGEAKFDARWRTWVRNIKTHLYSFQNQEVYIYEATFGDLTKLSKKDLEISYHHHFENTKKRKKKK